MFFDYDIQVGEANVSVDESLDETTVCFDMFFADPNDKNLVEVRSKKKSGDLLHLEVEARYYFCYRCFLCSHHS